MRAPVSSLIAVLALAGCVSGTRTVVVREYPAATPAPAPAPRPVPVPLPAPRRLAQLEVALGNPTAGKLPVQTNRAAYVAIFEIVPKQGVRLLHPSTAKQGRIVTAGLTYIQVGTQPAQASRPGSSSNARANRPVRYLYALASDTPIRIPDRAIEPGYLDQLIGPASVRAASPQPAIRALSREFAPKVSDEQWAEDLFVVEQSDTPTRMARIYCGKGRMYEVPEDVADRAWCPERSPNAGGTGSSGVMPTPARPDSVVGSNGRRIGPRDKGTPGRTADLPPRRAEPDRPDHPVKPRNEQAEKEKAEKEKADKEKADKEQAEKQRLEKEKADKDRAEKEKADKEKAEKERVEKAKADKEKADKEKADKERAEKEKVEKDRADKAKAEKEKAEREQVEKEREEKARAEQEKADKERAEKQKAEDERVKKEKEEKERAEKEKADKEKAEKEEAEKEKARKEKADKEEAERAQAEKEKAEKEKAVKEKAEKDDAEKQKAEKAEKDKSEKDQSDETNQRAKNSKAADSTKKVGSRNTPNRGRSTP